MRTWYLPILVVSALLLGACQSRLLAKRATPHVDLEAARATVPQMHAWPEYVTADERMKIEEALRVVWDVGGRDGRDAEKFIVSLDKEVDATSFRAVGRIVSEMKVVLDTIGLKDYEGKSRIMVLDRMLRKIDGVQERVFKEHYGVDLDDPPSRIERLVSVWNWWYLEGRFLERHEVWDFRVDMMDDPEDENWDDLDEGDD